MTTTDKYLLMGLDDTLGVFDIETKRQTLFPYKQIDQITTLSVNEALGNLYIGGLNGSIFVVSISILKKLITRIFL